jgi:phosphohistidine swiveling domain-containing protein/rhodanese-related sulfurtransferase
MNGTSFVYVFLIPLIIFFPTEALAIPPVMLTFAKTAIVLLKPIILLFFLAAFFLRLALAHCNHFFARYSSHIKFVFLSALTIVLLLFGHSNNFKLSPPAQAESLSAALHSNNEPLIIDARTDFTYDFWHIAGAYRTSSADVISSKIKGFLSSNPHGEIYILCHFGPRSMLVFKSIYEKFPQSDSYGIKRLSYGTSNIISNYPDRSFRAVRFLDKSLADGMARYGIAEKFVFSDAAQGPELQRLLSESPLPVTIFLKNKITADSIEYNLAGDSLARHFYIYEDGSDSISSLPSTNSLFIYITSSWRKYFGGINSLLVLLLLIFVISYAVCRYRGIRCFLLGKKSHYGYVTLALVIVFGISWNLIAKNDYEYYGLSPLNLFCWSPSMFSFLSIYSSIIITIWLSFTYPFDIRVKYIKRRLELNAHLTPTLSSIPNWNLSFIWTIVFAATVFLIPYWSWYYLPAIALILYICLKRLEAFIHITLPLEKASNWGLLPPILIYCIVDFNYFINPVFIVLFSVSLVSTYLIDFVIFKYLKYFVVHHDYLKLSRILGFCTSDAPCYYSISTYSPSHPGCATLTTNSGSCCFGLFSRRLIVGVNNTDIDDNSVAIHRMIDIASTFRSIFFADVSIGFDKGGLISSMAIQGKDIDDMSFIHSLMVRQNELSKSRDVRIARFDRTYFDELFLHPTVLSFELLTNRWKNRGSARRALSRCGYFLRDTHDEVFHLSNLGPLIYKDVVAEADLFRSNRVLDFIRRHIIKIHIKYYCRNGLNEFIDVVKAKADKRIASINKHVAHCRNMRVLTFHTVRYLHRLATECSFFQELISQLHYQSYLMLGKNPSDAISEALPPSKEVKYYDLVYLRDASASEVKRASKNATPLTNTLDTFDKLKAMSRDLYCEELRAVSKALFAIGSHYGIYEDIFHLHADQLKQIHRYDSEYLRSIVIMNERLFSALTVRPPARFSLEDFENMSYAKGELSSPHLEDAVRSSIVSPIKTPTAARIRHFDKIANYNNVTRQDVVVADTIHPDDVLKLANCLGFITERGSFLSHSAILARENKQFMIINYANATATLRDGLDVFVSQDGVITERSHPSPSADWLRIEEIRDPSDSGHKAYNLHILKNHGINIPPSAVIPWATMHGLFEYDANDMKYKLRGEAQLADILGEMSSYLTDPQSGFIVRSSTDLEDSPSHSFAGIFKSIPNLHGIDDISNAITSCYNHFIGTSQHLPPQVTPPHLNVLVQHFIKGVLGGVLFTQNPLNSSDKRFTLEVSFDGPLGVVNGVSVVSNITLTADGQIIDCSGNPLHEYKTLLCKLCRTASKIKDIFGRGQDIEWIADTNTLYVLQTRNITS